MMTATTPARTDCQIQFIDVNKYFGEVHVLHDINFCIKKSEFITLIGGSGSGKTTILKMINGLISSESGQILVDGVDITDKSAQEIIELRRNIGYAIQESALFPHMTVEKNIAYVPTLLNARDWQRTNETVRKWLDIVRLDESILSRYPDELSGGQKQRVGIARSLAANPEILLMDEPFGAVDEITRKQLQTEIKRIHEETGVTIVFVTHSISEALKLGTRVMVLENGRIVQFETPDQIREHPDSEFVRELLEDY